MPVVKGHNAKAAVESAVILDLGDLRREGERLLERAHVEAERIVAAAHDEAKSIVDAASARGYAEGHQRGTEEGRNAGHEAGRQEAHAEHAERLTALDASWTEALVQWSDARDAMMLDARSDVLAFAFEMARKIVLRVAAQDPKLVARQLEEALALLSRPTSLVVTVHSDDAELARTELPGLVARLGSGVHAELTTDDTMARGGCIVRTPDGGIDARLERQVERIAETLLPAHDDTPPDESAS